MSEVNTIIAKEKFICNGDLILKSITDKDGNELKKQINEWLNNNYDFEDVSRKKSGESNISGFKADSVNKQLRQKMSIIHGVHGESCVEYGSILSKAKKGFDFSLYDEEYYIKKLRNAFIGEPGRFNGKKELDDIYRRVKDSNDKIYTKKKWHQTLDSLGGTDGVSIDTNGKSRYTVVGEIQFGNWALSEHDLIRLINSENSGEIDFYVYITATGKLQSMLSDQTVNYDVICKAFESNKQLIHTPAWIIGLDIR